MRNRNFLGLKAWLQAFEISSTDEEIRAFISQKAYQPTTFKTMLDQAIKVALSLGNATKAMTYIAHKEAQLMALQKRYSYDAKKDVSPHSVLCLIEQKETKVGGLWIPDVVDLAGGNYLVPLKGQSHQVYGVSIVPDTKQIRIVDTPVTSLQSTEAVLYLMADEILIPSPKLYESVHKVSDWLHQ